MSRAATYREALHEALREEMERDDTVVLLGEDIVAGGAFGVAGDLAVRFGRERIIQTPISENGFVGIAVGAANAAGRFTIAVNETITRRPPSELAASLSRAAKG